MLGLLTFTCSVVCLLPQAYFNKLRLPALEVPGFIFLWCLEAQRKGMVINMADYDTVFVGFPIWWYVAPTIINTFLESYDFSGKTIVPFCTSGGSGAGKTDQVLHALCPDSVDWRPCKLLNGRPSAAQLKKWVDSLHLG